MAWIEYLPNHTLSKPTTYWSRRNKTFKSSKPLVNTSVFIIYLKVGKQPTSTDFTLQPSKLQKDSGWFSVVLSLVTNVSSTSQESDSFRLHTLFLGGWLSLPLLRLFSVNTSLFSLADPGSIGAVKWHITILWEFDEL